jgi:hypothetical protein
MAGSISDYLENAVLLHLTKGALYVPPTHLYLALFTVAPNDTGGGTEVPNTNGYVRQIVDAWTVSGSNPAQAQNTNLITFPAANPAGWGTILGLGLFDSLVSGSGNLLWWNDGLNQAIGINGVAEFLPNSITLTAD